MRARAAALAIAVASGAGTGPPSRSRSASSRIGRGQAPILGQNAGIFKKHGITLEIFGTAGAGETVQAVISGSADFGISVGIAGRAARLRHAARRSA